MQCARLTPSPVWWGRGPNLVSRVVPHLRGECPVIPTVHWKGVVLPRQSSSRTLKIYPIVRAFIVGFLQLRDFCN